MIDYGLQGRVAVVTGAGSGIGRATAKMLADQGSKVALVARTASALQEVKDEIAAAGGEAAAFVCDVGDDGAAKQMAEAVLAEYGQVDVLANVAGVEVDFSKAPLLGQLAQGPDPFDIPKEEWDRVLNTNMRGHFNTMKYFTPSMRENHYGRIVNVTSVTAFTVAVGSAVYVGSKAAANTMVYLYARRLGPDGITVNCVAPGFVDTPMHKDSPPEQRTMIPQFTPLRRAGEPDDIARAILFFAQRDLFVTGQVLVVDGGTFPR
ncbi:MAG: SDR family oxidoreductase [Actinobacteria bacterium]|nr:SDR family oxidoreductase [Actinomycetota bacterium]